MKPVRWLHVRLLFLWAIATHDVFIFSFGITSAIFLDQLTPDGRFVNTLEVPNSTQPGVSSTDDQLVTSFP